MRFYFASTHNLFLHVFASITILFCTSNTGFAKTIICDSSQLIPQILSGSNNTYIIQEKIDLDGETVIIGNNSILRFEGGCFANGKMMFNYTLIDGNALFDNVVLKGKIMNYFVDFSWFGAIGDGIHDDAQAIQKAIDACASLDNITTVSGADGIYLVSKPINLSSNPKLSRHNISIVGRTRPNPNVRKGLNILGRTGDGNAIIECIDCAQNIFENIGLFSDGENASTIGIVIARGEEMRFVPHATMLNCYIGIDINNKDSGLKNNGYGTIGILSKDMEESEFLNCDIWANCCVVLANQGKVIRKIAVDKEKRLTSNTIDFHYQPFHKTASVSKERRSNTVFRFEDCRFIEINGEAPAVIGEGVFSLRIRDSYFQRRMAKGAKGNYDVALHLNDAWHLKVEGVTENFGSLLFNFGSLDHSDIDVAMVIMEKGEAPLLLFKELDATARSCINNKINIRSNYTEVNLVSYYPRSPNAINSIFHIKNNVIKTNVRSNDFLSNARLFESNNTVEFCDVTYNNYRNR